MEKLTGLFNLPGEGFVVQLRDGTTSSLYDKQGLQFLILDRKQKGLDTAVAEKALAQMNPIQNSIGLHF